jgi:glycosyltransferase involved in cell wall biosynthesis
MNPRATDNSIGASLDLDLSPSGSKAVDQKCLTVTMVDAGSYSLWYDYALCDGLTQNGCDVTLMRCEFRHGPWDIAGSFAVRKHFYQWTHAAGRRLRAGLLWKATKATEHLVDMRRLVEDLRRSKPDVIHFQWLPLPLLDRLFLHSLSRIAPLVMTMHNTEPYHGTPTSMLNVKGLQQAFRHFSAIIVHSEFSRTRMIDRGWARPEQLHVVPHAVFEPDRSVPPAVLSDPQENIILHLGSIQPYKGLDVLLRAFALLPEELQRSSRIILAGPPRMNVATLQDLAKSLGIDSRVSWDLRFLSEAEVAALYQRATIVALPYREVDQSAALMSAIGFEKPVIATSIGGIPETIRNGVHGYLVERDDAQGFGRALGDLLAHPDRRRAMEAAMHDLRNHLTWARSAQSTVAVYESLLKP